MARESEAEVKGEAEAEWGVEIEIQIHKWAAKIGKEGEGGSQLRSEGRRRFVGRRFPAHHLILLSQHPFEPDLIKLPIKSAVPN